MNRTIPSLAAALAASAMLLAAPIAEAKTFRFATTSDAATLDPHANNAIINVLVLVQIYEPLVTRDKELRVTPALATRWEQPEPNRWRFHLRPNVKFHNGAAFDADDVVFSIKRALSPTSNYGIYVDTVADVVKVDALTVDIVTKAPDAIVPDKLTRIYMMDKEWAEANRSERPQNFREKEETFAARNTNGTGPFMLKSREPDVRTVLSRNPSWWGTWEGNVTEYVHVPISSDATRVAALLSGEIDLVHTVPIQDMARLGREPRVKVVVGQENRTLFLGMDQHRDELLYSNVKGKNPFKDIRVRQAIYHAVDIEAIKRRAMRGYAEITGSMWTQYVNGWSKETDGRLPFDREKAKQLLAEAGYPNGFQVTLDCPVGTYDEVCQALAPMMAQIGIEVKVNIQPAALTFQKYAKQDTSFFALAWGVPTFDALYTLRGLIVARDKVGAASWNAGGYANPKVDDLVARVAQEVDQDKRRALIIEAHKIHNGEIGHIPLYHQMIPWAMAANVTAPHRADNILEIKWVKVD